MANIEIAASEFKDIKRSEWWLYAQEKIEEYTQASYKRIAALKDVDAIFREQGKIKAYSGVLQLLAMPTSQED